MNSSSPSARGNSSDRLLHRLSDLSDRLRIVENRKVLTVGNWRLEENATGDLVASNPTTGVVTVIALAQLKEEHSG